MRDIAVVGLTAPLYVRPDIGKLSDSRNFFAQAGYKRVSRHEVGPPVRLALSLGHLQHQFFHCIGELLVRGGVAYENNIETFRGL